MQICYEFFMRTEGLETLLWIVRLGGVGAAARHMNLTQPAVTRRIRELERDLNARLFYRSGRGVQLTAIGQSCAIVAERIVADAGAFRQTSGADALLSATIRLGVAEVVALTWLHRLLAKIEKNYPMVQIELDIDLTTNLITKLEQGTIDIAFLPGHPTIQGSVRTSLGLSPLRWMCKPGFWGRSKILTPKDLANVPIFTLSRGSNSYAIMTGWFSEAGIVPQQIGHCNSLTVIATLVERGIGVSLLPLHLFGDRVRAKKLSALAERPKVPVVEYWAVHRPIAGFPILGRIAELAKAESSFEYSG
jgi:DNA-binding transcriptional LysR family regulator